MWKSTVEGRELTFEMVGLNNQNFIMRDQQTGTWWQQVTGQAIHGPLKGRQLELMPSDDVSFAIWKRENPDTKVLSKDERFAKRYFNVPDDRNEGWGLPMPGEEPPQGGLKRGDLVIGVILEDAAKAYPLKLLKEQNPIADLVGRRPVLLAVAPDGRSVRCFDREVEGRRLDLYLKPDAEEFRLLDAQTGSEWDFSGTAVSGPLKGQQLKRLPAVKDFWFDWRAFRPDAPVYKGGVL